jgi:serine/threonine protein kinase
LACLDEQTVIDLVEGHLPAERRLGVIAHADLCGDCRQVIAALTRTLHPDTQSTSAPEGGPSSPLHAGSSLGRYVILDVVGSGGMGVVYSAYDPELDRRVALKLVRTPNGPDAESQRARLVREARAIARVVHPNAIVVHEVGTLDKRVFVAMEFVDGPTLSAWLRARPRSPREKLDVLIQAGRGLAAAHHAGLVHRDFKPDNVLVGADGRVRVTDFGLARAAGLAGEVAPPALPTTDVTITRSGAVVGTPAYMAPEQVLGAGADARADVFSFCVTAWECLFGARPFAGATLQALLEAVRAGRLVEGGDQTVPARIRNMLARGLSHDP